MLKTALQLKTIGNILRDKRKELNKDLKEVSEITRIRIDYLKALEDGNYRIFPSEVYLKGFLKNYAKYLNINTDKALALYRRENENKEPELLSGVESEINKKRTIIFTPNKILTFIAIGAILLIVIYLASYVGQVLRKPNLELTSPTAFSEEGEVKYVTDANFINLQGKVEIGSSLTINDIELQLNNFEEFAKEYPLSEGENTFILKAESQFGREKVITLNIDKKVTLTPTPTINPLLNQMDLLIEIIGQDTTVNLAIDGVTKTERLYKVGSTMEFIAFESIEVRTQRPSSLKISINNVEYPITNVINSWTLTNGVILQN